MREHEGPHRIRVDGPVVALAQPFDRFVAVQPKHQHITLRLAAFQQIHMPRMQNVIASVGEDDPFAFPAQGIQFFQQFGQFDHAGMFQHIHCPSFVRPCIGREGGFRERRLSGPTGWPPPFPQPCRLFRANPSCPPKAERSPLSKAPLWPFRQLSTTSEKTVFTENCISG